MASPSPEALPALPDLMTGRQVCDLLHISKSTLIPWRDAGHLEAVQMPTGWRYPKNQPLIARALAAIAGR